MTDIPCTPFKCCALSLQEGLNRELIDEVNAARAQISQPAASFQQQVMANIDYLDCLLDMLHKDCELWTFIISTRVPYVLFSEYKNPVQWIMADEVAITLCNIALLYQRIATQNLQGISHSDTATWQQLNKLLKQGLSYLRYDIPVKSETDVWETRTLPALLDKFLQFQVHLNVLIKSLMGLPGTKSTLLNRVAVYAQNELGSIITMCPVGAWRSQLRSLQKFVTGNVYLWCALEEDNVGYAIGFIEMGLEEISDLKQSKIKMKLQKQKQKLQSKFNKETASCPQSLVPLMSKLHEALESQHYSMTLENNNIKFEKVITDSEELLRRLPGGRGIPIEIAPFRASGPAAPQQTQYF